jgi:hypothetical protein
MQGPSNPSQNSLRWALWSALILTIYFLSWGPMTALALKGTISPQWLKPYQGLAWLRIHTPLQSPFNAYLRWWAIAINGPNY